MGRIESSRRNDGRKIADAATTAPGDTRDLVADERRQHDDRARRDLPDRQRIEELLGGDPVQLIHDLILDEGDDGEAATESHGSHFEEEDADVPQARWSRAAAGR